MVSTPSYTLAVANDQRLVASGIRTDGTLIVASADTSVLLIAVRIAIANSKAVQEAAVNGANLDVA
jgi:hypothetical protein